jgi:transcriptional regulator with XRE-family HTH domain
LLHFLHFLHVVREDRGLSLAQLARAIGTHPDRCARYKRGERPRDPQTIQRLADALSVSPEVFTANAITLYRDGRIEVTR